MDKDQHGEGERLAGDGAAGSVKAPKAAALAPEPRGFLVANTKNYTLEFCIRGRWIRWEPVKQDGFIREVTKEEAADPEFQRLAALYFSVRRATK